MNRKPTTARTPTDASFAHDSSPHPDGGLMARTLTSLRQRWANNRRRLGPRQVIAAVVITAAFALVLLYEIRLVGDWRVDDAYITFSYSKNLGSGHGPVYSHDVRVEGYSNFLWMVLVAVGYVFSSSLDVMTFARVLATVSLVGLAFVTYRLARMRANSLVAGAAVVLLAFTTDITRATLSGLETIPYTALLAAAGWAYVKESPAARRYSLYWFVGAALMRIDGCVPLAFALGFEAVASVVERRFDPRAFVRWAAVPLAVYAAYFVWRFWYYGLPLPTTYYAKSMVTANEPDRGYTYVWDAVRASGGLAALAIALFGIGRRPSRGAVFLLTYTLVHAAYVIHVGGDWIPFDRFLLPVFPLVIVLFAWGAAEPVRVGAYRSRLAHVSLAGVAASSFVFVAERVDAHLIDTPPEAHKLGEANHIRNHTKVNLLAAKRLLPYITREPGQTLVTDYAGVFSLYTDASVIDMWGLCNEKIAREGVLTGINPIYGKTCPSCYEEWMPDYFHANVPLLQPAGAYKTFDAVLGAVFQSNAIDRYVHFRKNYAVGRVVDTATDQAVFFLEKRRPRVRLESREPHPGVVVDYPFEPRA